MKSEFVTAITQLAAEKGVPREMVMEAIQQALVSAYKQHEEDSRLITAEIDNDSGEPHVYHWLTVVEDIPDDVEDDSNLIILEQARTLKSPEGQVLFPDAKPGDQIYEDVTPAAVRAHRRADRKAGGHAETARRRTATGVQPVRRTRGRDRSWRHPAHRSWHGDHRDRSRRGRHAPHRASPNGALLPGPASAGVRG